MRARASGNGPHLPRQAMFTIAAQQGCVTLRQVSCATLAVTLLCCADASSWTGTGPVVRMRLSGRSA
jgi:hypothetical protein